MWRERKKLTDTEDGGLRLVSFPHSSRKVAFISLEEAHLHHAGSNSHGRPGRKSTRRHHLLDSLYFAVRESKAYASLADRCCTENGWSKGTMIHCMWKHMGSIKGCCQKKGI
ncbi:uncharacterized protein LOC108319884 [Vigna angularis]|uniref:uncharacterized protein LOC108319884 n=1 Tax=Phaseolus angularis TaxID=3914 RepID=UPI0022B456CF|nr:uncharacterized protein LOC108319884 [Vigna angularis]